LSVLLKKLELIPDKEINEQLIPYITDLLEKDRKFKYKEMGDALSKYAIALTDAVIDIPKLTENFARLLFSLIDKNIIESKDLNFRPQKKVTEDGDEDLPLIDEIFRLMAYFLIQLYEHKYNSWKNVVDYYNKSFRDKMEELIPDIIEDNIFDDLAEKVGPDYAEVIVPLLD
jgi:hypothetical protein